MPIFGTSFYHGRQVTDDDVARYKHVLTSVLTSCPSPSECEQLLKDEAVEVTRHIIEAVRVIIKKDRHVRDLVLNQGAIPLATWTDHLRALSHRSLPYLQAAIGEMRRGMEQGQVGGFAGTMILYDQPTFATFEPFYTTIFTLAGLHDHRTER